MSAVPGPRPPAPHSPAPGTPTPGASHAPRLPDPDRGETGPYAHLGFCRARAGFEDRVAELILGLVDPLRSQDVALEFHVHRDRADPRTFVIYEMYRSKADLERHVAQPYTQEFIAAVRPYVEGPLQQQFLRMLPLARYVKLRDTTCRRRPG